MSTANLSMAMLTLLAFATNARAETVTNNTSIIFRDIGTYLQVHATIHVSLEVDLSPYQDHCDQLNKPTSNETNRNPPFTPSAFRAHRTLMRGIRHACHEVEQLNGHPAGPPTRYPREHTEPQQGPDRQPRQLGLAVLAVTSIYTIYEVNRLQHLAETLRHSQQLQETLLTHTLRRAQDMEERAKERDHDLQQILDLEQHLSASREQIGWLHERIALVSEFYSDVQRSGTALQELRRGHLSPFLLSQDEAKVLLSRLQQKARILDGTPVIETFWDLFQLPITVICTGPYKYQVLLHVGIIKERHRVYRFHSSPIALREGKKQVTLMVVPHQRLLVHNVNSHQELTEADLDSCDRRANTYICNGPTAFHTQLRKSCLGSLFAGELSSIRALCPIQQSNVSWTAESLASDQVALYFRDRTNIQITCPGVVRRNQDLQGHHVIPLPANCSLTGLDLRINARADVLLQVPVATHPHWGSAELLEGKTPQEILEVRAHLQRRLVYPADEVGRMLQQEAAEDGAQATEAFQEQHHYGLYAAVVVVVVVVVAVSYRYFRLYRQTALRVPRVRHEDELKTLN